MGDGNEFFDWSGVFSHQFFKGAWWRMAGKKHGSVRIRGALLHLGGVWEWTMLPS